MIVPFIVLDIMDREVQMSVLKLGRTMTDQ